MLELRPDLPLPSATRLFKLLGSYSNVIHVTSKHKIHLEKKIYSKIYLNPPREKNLFKDILQNCSFIFGGYFHGRNLTLRLLTHLWMYCNVVNVPIEHEIKSAIKTIHNYRYVRLKSLETTYCLSFMFGLFSLLRSGFKPLYTYLELFQSSPNFQKLPNIK